MGTPNGRSASFTALAMAAGGTDGAAFAAALLAEAGVGRGRLHMLDPQRRRLGSAGQRIVGKRRGAGLAGVVKRHLLQKCRADALGDAADDLAIDDHRVHQHPAVLAHGVVQGADLAGLGIDADGLPPVLDPADGTAEAPGQEAGDHLPGQAEAPGQAGADDVRHLRAAVQDKLAHAPVPMRDQAAAPDGRHVLPGGAQGAADGDGGTVAGRGRAEVHAGFQEHVAAPVRVELRRARLAPGQHVGHCGQFLQVQHDLLGQVLRRGAGGGDADGDGLADMAHPVGCERVLRRGLEAQQGGVGDDCSHAGQVGCGEHLIFRPGRLADAEKPRMGQRAAHEGEVLHAGEAQVGDELALAAQVAAVLDAGDRGADALCDDGCRRGGVVHVQFISMLTTLAASGVCGRYLDLGFHSR